MQRLASSFRDSRGFVEATRGGSIKRVILKSGIPSYKLLMSSGLYDELTSKGLLVKHTELKEARGTHSLVIRPEKISFISYPFEWSIEQYRAAAECTLAIQKIALKYGMTLRDASAYNIQFEGTTPIFIDTLSFEKYTPGQPWQAYGQFCRHFLAPLLLACKTDTRLTTLMRSFIDGVPLDLAAKLLPISTKIRPSIFMHVAYHAKMVEVSDDKKHIKKVTAHISPQAMQGILDNLGRLVRSLRVKSHQTVWDNYYNETNYSTKGFDNKQELVKKLLLKTKSRSVLDFGGNNGEFSRVSTGLNIKTVCIDFDENAVLQNYLASKRAGDSFMLPLVVDIINPGGKIGWANSERDSIDTRIQVDTTMALAIIHHLAIANNLPLEHVAEYLSRFSPNLIIEFVPKSDSQVKKLLTNREDIFTEYTQVGFEKAFSKYYRKISVDKVKGSKRLLYLMKRKPAKK